MLINLGYLAFHYGYYSRAVDCYERAWALTEALPKTDAPAEQNIISDAGIKLAGMYSRLGRRVELEKLIKDLDAFPKQGMDARAFELAAQGAALMKVKPSTSFNCGPMALMNIAAANPGLRGDQKVLIDAKATPDKGFTLAQLEVLAKNAGLRFQAVKREPGTKLILPAVVHWKSNHYAAILEEKDGRFHVKDPTFLTDFWISAKALEDEASGYFLVPSEAIAVQLPDGWRSAEAAATGIAGRGVTSGNSQTNQTPACDCSTGAPAAAKATGMAQVSIDKHQATFFIVDTPVGYTPPKGPALPFELAYNEGKILSTPPGGTIGVSGNLSEWTLNCFSAVQYPNNTGNIASEFTPDGRIETYATDNATVNVISGAVMEVVTSGNTTSGFKEHFPDGSEWDYLLPQSGNATNPYYFFNENDRCPGQQPDLQL